MIECFTIKKKNVKIIVTYNNDNNGNNNNGNSLIMTSKYFENY